MNQETTNRLHVWAALSLDSEMPKRVLLRSNRTALTRCSETFGLDSEDVDEALRLAGLDPATCAVAEARAAVREYFHDLQSARYTRSLD